MSLTTCPHCHQTNSRWRIYLWLNKRQKRSHKVFVCHHCHQDCHLVIPHHRKRKYLGVVIRGLIPLIVMIGFVQMVIPRRQAMISIVLYHFACFIGIIQYSRRKEETSQK